MRSTPSPPPIPEQMFYEDDPVVVWEEAWSAGFRAALCSVTTEQLALPMEHEPRWGFDL